VIYPVISSALSLKFIPVNPTYPNVPTIIYERNTKKYPINTFLIFFSGSLEFFNKGKVN